MNSLESKRLAILGTRGIPARYGGFETFAEELALHLVAKGVDVTVYCEADLQQPQPDHYQGVKLVYLPVTPCGPLTTVLFDLRSLWHARRGYDVVYMLGYGAAPFCFIPRLWGSQVWINVDGVEWARAKWSALAQRYFRAMEWFSTWVPNRIIADAEGIRVHLESRHRFTTPCSVISYGAPIVETEPAAALLAEWGLNPASYYLVVARIEPENHVREIVEGYLASSSPFPLVVVGDHQSGTPYARSVAACADSRVRFLGGVYDKAKLQALRCHALAYCHGHSVGGTNPSLLEALGCGNLVIAHDNVFNREVTGDLGFYFKTADDLPALLARIELQDEASRSGLHLAAKQRILETYSWDRICNNYLALLEDAPACSSHIALRADVPAK
jgi:glycosyltransferase involved in cell wall biosynthesis